MWDVETTDLFDEWFMVQTQALKIDMLAAMHLLEEFGPQLGRPYVDTVNESNYANMKELRIQHAGNPVRAFFAFDPGRKAVVLCAGSKRGVNERRFYKEMIRLADNEFSKHLVK
ncbi:type II toxin-antitoxin system RelE/ParE family toxin [Yokenella regensburgei]|jgi:hypothetical protein|uniref:Uncharacterized protein conserved in bacteria n=1 Tax=Yokenella regensburgei TaxID=158877 RepID=A0AB38FSZ6_9ENTR|nr:type II toxin-antitoxin system RelE/ParE family toxin [Yokenella regensburgei]KFD23409.1 hypothetical protein GYRE_02197 [Yokenella regensburgei ATCC 49455]RKR54324.1 hypothetical protein C7387_2480 [Yokenella regensburgei]SQA62422.1 Uncharacterized protein conserved in bacteria [Yokenella regensburgei]SQA96088.1 Uncharacterized protein conserved in bacteria [Yokenella regensburgei]SUQ04210.1 Uncharacterized protein conserved in bacteria [Yokenella regensburgei]